MFPQVLCNCHTCSWSWVACFTFMVEKAEHLRKMASAEGSEAHILKGVIPTKKDTIRCDHNAAAESGGSHRCIVCTRDLGAVVSSSDPSCSQTVLSDSVAQECSSGSCGAQRVHRWAGICRNPNTDSEEQAHPCVHCSIVYSSRAVEATEVSVRRRVDERAVVRVRSGVGLGHKKRRHSYHW